MVLEDATKVGPKAMDAMKPAFCCILFIVERNAVSLVGRKRRQILLGPDK